MTEAEVEVRWKALAAVDASEAKIALELLRELKELRDYKSKSPLQRTAQETEAIKNVDNARYVLANIASMVVLAGKMGLVPSLRPIETFYPPYGADEHAKEVAAYDAKAKAFYGSIVRQVVDLVNRTRTKAERIAFPTPEDEIGTGLVEALADYISDQGEVNLTNEWLRKAYRDATHREAPKRPGGWGMSATAGPVKTGPMTAGATDKAIESFNRHAAFENDLKAKGAAELKEANTTDGENKRAWDKWSAEYVNVNKEEVLAKMREAWNDLQAAGLQPPIDPEKLAAAATRAANGLPAETDPAVTQINPEKPAGHHEKGSGV